MTKQKEVKRIKVRENKYQINQDLERMQDAIDLWESFSEHLNSIDLEMPDKIRLSVIKKGVGCDEVVDFIKNEFKDLPKRIREREELELYDDINDWQKLYGSRPDWTYVEIKKGIAKPIKDAEKIITEKSSYHLSETEDIELYSRFMDWIEEGNALWDELKPMNKGHVQYLHNTFYHKDDGGIWTNNEAINFSKSQFKNQ